MWKESRISLFCSCFFTFFLSRRKEICRQVRRANVERSRIIKISYLKSWLTAQRKKVNREWKSVVVKKQSKINMSAMIVMVCLWAAVERTNMVHVSDLPSGEVLSQAFWNLSNLQNRFIVICVKVFAELFQFKIQFAFVFRVGEGQCPPLLIIFNALNCNELAKKWTPLVSFPRKWINLQLLTLIARPFQGYSNYFSYKYVESFLVSMFIFLFRFSVFC